MGKSVHNNVLDAALNYIVTNADRICVCSTEPTTYAQATSSYMLAIKTISSSDFTGPADGDSSGRKITSNQHSSISVTTGGSAQHVALADSSPGTLLYVTTCSTKTLGSSDKVTVPTWDIEIADPA